MLLYSAPASIAILASEFHVSITYHKKYLPPATPLMMDRWYGPSERVAANLLLEGL